MSKQQIITSQVKDLDTKLANKQNTITGAASTVTTNDLNENKVLISNASGKISTSSITTTELDTLDNISSNIQEQINSLSIRGRFLSIWNCTTGLATTTPTTLPYTYKAGDFFIVGTVGNTNYKPTGSSYTGTASTIVETSTVAVNDVYYFDGTNWIFQINTEREVTFSSIAGQPSDNTNLGIALDAKQDVLTAGDGISIVNNVITNTRVSAEWGNIVGNIDDQTDLKNSLDAKQNKLNNTNVTTTGNGNIVDSVTASNGTISITKNTTLNNPTITFIQSGIDKGSITLNQDQNQIIRLDGSVPTINLYENKTGNILNTELSFGNSIMVFKNGQFLIGGTGKDYEITNAAEGTIRFDTSLLSSDKIIVINCLISGVDLTPYQYVSNLSQDITESSSIKYPSSAAVKTGLDTKVNKNADIIGATKCKITYDNKGLVTSGADLNASDIPSLELSKISDVTASSTEVNQLSGVSSNVQTQIDNKVTKNTDITGATKCKVTYDNKGLVTSGSDLSASDIPDISNTYATNTFINKTRTEIDTTNVTLNIAENTWYTCSEPLTSLTITGIANSTLESCVSFTVGNGFVLNLVSDINYSSSIPSSWTEGDTYVISVMFGVMIIAKTRITTSE